MIPFINPSINVKSLARIRRGVNNPIQKSFLMINIVRGMADIKNMARKKRAGIRNILEKINAMRLKINKKEERSPIFRPAGV